jgi:hypothetical protein
VWFIFVDKPVGFSRLGQRIPKEFRRCLFVFAGSRNPESISGFIVLECGGEQSCRMINLQLNGFCLIAKKRLSGDGKGPAGINPHLPAQPLGRVRTRDCLFS